jgi:site-specific DNA-methyltransferase (adenine-specific)
MTNKLFYGDNLEVLRAHVADESVDLIYLDPPFNSNANYNILFSPRPATAPTRRSRRSRTPGTGTTRRRTPSTG